jgi:haloalkane dehalogenase
VTELPPEVLAGYERPFPTPASKAGMRAFPGLIPQTPEHPTARVGQQLVQTLAADGRPKLVLWAQQDFVLPPKVGEAVAGVFGADGPVPIEGAGHFLQEDKGPEIGAHIVDWLGGH